MKEENTIDIDILEKYLVMKGMMNESILNDDSLELDFMVLPIFILFICCGVFGNVLVCLAISTNRYLIVWPIC